MGRQVKFTDEQKHQETLAVLENVLDYLQRLPSVPATTAMCEKIKAHMDKPAQRLVAESKRELIGMWVTPAGKRMFEASLIGDQLTVSVPDPAGDRRNAPGLPAWGVEDKERARQEVAAAVVKSLMRPAGVTVKLVKPSPALTKRA
jgi:hypothetical protein